MARDDDVINVAGHRLSTSAIEEVLLTHPGVGDAAVVGVADKLKGQLPLGVVVPRPGYAGDLAQELVAKVSLFYFTLAATPLEAYMST